MRHPLHLGIVERFSPVTHVSLCNAIYGIPPWNRGDLAFFFFSPVLLQVGFNVLLL